MMHDAELYNIVPSICEYDYIILSTSALDPKYPHRGQDNMMLFPSDSDGNVLSWDPIISTSEDFPHAESL